MRFAFNYTFFSSFTGELLKAVEMHENDRQIANRKLLGNSKLEVDYRMLQLQVSKFEEEHKRLQEVVSTFFIYHVTQKK